MGAYLYDGIDDSKTFENNAVEVTINGVRSVLVDCYDIKDIDLALSFFDELCEAERAGASSDVFDQILASHGCTPGGTGILYDIEWQGWDVVDRNDGSKYLAMQCGYEIVNPNYVPNITTTFVPEFRFEQM